MDRWRERFIGTRAVSRQSRLQTFCLQYGHDRLARKKLDQCSSRIRFFCARPDASHNGHMVLDLRWEGANQLYATDGQYVADDGEAELDITRSNSTRVLPATAPSALS